MGVDIPFDRSFQSYQELVLLQVLELPNTWKTLCFPSTVRVDNIAFRVTLILEDTLCFLSTIGIENRSFHSYQNPVNSESWHFYRLQLQSYQNPVTQWELTFLPFRATISGFQSYLTPGERYASSQLSESTIVAFRAT